MDKSKNIQKPQEGRIESRSMNFFNSEYNNRKLDFVPKKVMSNKFIKSDFEEATVNFTKGGFNKKFLVNGGGSIIELNTASGKIKINKK